MLSELTIYIMATLAGFKGHKAHTMVCIARYESHYNPLAINADLNRNGSADLGLFQINDRMWQHGVCKGLDLLTPTDNTKCAYRVYKRQGFKAWAAYTKYKTRCDHYKVKK